MIPALRPLLPFWLAGPEAGKLADAARAFFVRWEAWLLEALAQASIADCSAAALELHAIDRGIDRLPGEPLATWRDRVQHAVTSAREAGSLQGLTAILTVHGLQNFAITERDPGQDWDVILVELDPSQLHLDSDNLTRVLNRWGRLCRRYAASYTMSASGAVAPFHDDATFIFATATE
jgi:hypothetical protein